VVKDLGRGDIIIISGNALDFQKNVGMKAGSVGMYIFKRCLK